jgi:hypothetical protein
MRDVKLSHHSSEKIVVTPSGRVRVTAAAADLLSDIIGNDERLSGTSYELDYALVARVPDSELTVFCDAVGCWLENLSTSERSLDEIEQISRLHATLAPTTT